MRILIVVARLNQGGVSKYISELVPGLLRRGFKIKIASGFVQNGEKEDEIASDLPLERISHLGRRISLWNDLKARHELKLLIKNFEPDLIYSHTFKAGLLVRSLLTRTPKIHAYHGHLLNVPDMRGIKLRIWILIEKILAKQTVKIVTTGKKISDDLIAANIGKKSQYVSIPPGIPDGINLPKTSALKNLGITGNYKKIVVWLGRFVEVKNPGLVLEIAARLPEVLFVMAGDGVMRGDLLKSSPPNVKIVNWCNPILLWSIADAAINTSFSEGMSMSIIEAQFHGVPVIATDVGSTSEIVVPGVTGFLVENKASAFENKIRDLLENQTLLKSFSHEGKIISKREFGVEKFVSRHSDLFSTVTS